MEKKKLLIITAPIKSHIIPSFYLYENLKDRYEIKYLVTNPHLGKLVEEFGGEWIEITRYQIGGRQEKDMIEEKGYKANWLNESIAIINNDIYKRRRNELEKIIISEKPSAIIIDVFNSIDYYVLHKFEAKIKIAFFNPMLSLYNIEGQINIKNELYTRSKSTPNMHKKRGFKEILYKWQDIIIRTKSRVKNEVSFKERNFTLLFENVPEFILSPLEFEYCSFKKSYQYYLGLCIIEKKINYEIDNEYEELFEIVKKQRCLSKKIIYCSFGSFYQGNIGEIEVFLRNLILAIRGLDDIVLIVSINKNFIYKLKDIIPIPANVFIFNKVRQLEMLEISDMHISHGGLGSIKESILKEVPMLIYPLDKNFDQITNARRVEKLNIGINGYALQFGSSEILKKQIDVILNSSEYKNTIRKTKLKILKNEDYGQSKKILNNF